MKAINKSHDLIKQIKKTKTKNNHDGLAYVEQIGVLEKFSQSKMRDKFEVRHLILCEELIKSDTAHQIKDTLLKRANDVYGVSPSVYELICEKKYGAGIFAVIDFYQPDITEFIQSDYQHIVVLDGLETPGNIGTIFRTADACGVDAIVLCDVKPKIYSRKCISASRGMVFDVPSISLDYENAKSMLLDAGYSLYLCEPEDGLSYDKVDYKKKKAMVFGSERFGINQDWFTRPHQNIFIPMKGSMTSLNVAVAASLIMYESANKL